MRQDVAGRSCGSGVALDACPHLRALLHVLCVDAGAIIQTLLQIVIHATIILPGRASIAQLVVATVIEVLNAGHLELVSVDELVMGLVRMLMVGYQRWRSTAHWHRLVRVGVQILHGVGTILLRIDDHAGVAGRGRLEMVMRMFNAAVRVVMTRMRLVGRLVMLDASGGPSVVAVVIVEPAVGVHDDTSLV